MHNNGSGFEILDSFILLLENDYMFETLGFGVDNDCESFCC